MDIEQKLKGASEYDVIAFDMDLCLAEYKMKPFFHLLFESIATELVNRYGYPKEIFPDEKDEAFHYSFFQKGFIDKRNWNILKVGENFEVLVAYQGHTKLTNEEIKAVYGEDPQIDGINLKTMKSKDYVFVGDYFYAEVLLFVLRASVLRKTGKYPKLNNLSGKELINDCYGAGDLTFHNLQNKDCRTKGLYTPYLSARPQKYLKLVPDELKKALKALKDSGKIILLITNSQFGYFDVIFHYVYGLEYFDVFDLIGLQAQKPKFWSEPTKRIYRVDLSKPEGINEESDQENFDFKKDKMWVQGNYNYLSKYLVEKLGKTDFTGIYFGDNPSGDMYARFMKGWDTAFIFAEYGEKSGDWNPEEHYDYRPVWGSALSGTTVDGKEVKTFLHGLCSEFTRVFSKISSKECIAFLNS